MATTAGGSCLRKWFPFTFPFNCTYCLKNPGTARRWKPNVKARLLVASRVFLCTNWVFLCLWVKKKRGGAQIPMRMNTMAILAIQLEKAVEGRRFCQALLKFIHPWANMHRKNNQDLGAVVRRPVEIKVRDMHFYTGIQTATVVMPTSTLNLKYSIGIMG